MSFDYEQAARRQREDAERERIIRENREREQQRQREEQRRSDEMNRRLFPSNN